MAKSLIAAALLLAACGAAPQADTSPPTPPAERLAAWKDFPAGAEPRPIVWFWMDNPGLGYAENDSKVAAVCARYQLASGVQLPALPKTAFATWKSGVRTPYAAISAADALAGLRRPSGDQPNPECASVPPLVITAARLGDAGMVTDRGTATVSAYLFTATGATGEFSYPALDPSAYWRHGATLNMGNGGVQGARISVDGLRLTVAFIGAETSGDCGASYVASAAESQAAVAVAIKVIPINTSSAICDAVGHQRTVSVTLAAPLGGRVLLDQQGNVLAVCPEARDC
jgi:hypothetical protein